MAQAQLQRVTEAKGEMEAVGVNGAMSGAAPAGASGRAIQALQAGGQVELGPLLDTLRSWQMRVYRKVWGRIRQFWTEARWVRITNDERNLNWVGLNRPVTLAQQLIDELGTIPPEMVGDPALEQVVALENALTELDVDIIVGEVPDTVSIRQEEFKILAELAKNGLPIPPAALIEASGIRGKEQILKSLTDPAQAQNEAQAADKAILERELMLGEIQEKQARANKTEAEAAAIRDRVGGLG